MGKRMFAMMIFYIPQTKTLKLKRVLKLILIMISFLYSCTSKDEFDQASNLINIDLNESKDGKFSDVFDDPKYTLLDFSDDKPLVNPYNIK